MREVEIPLKELRAEFMLFGWLQQGASIRYAEITNAIERNEIDRGVLKINFMSSVSPSVLEALGIIMQERDDFEPVFKEVTLSKKVRKYYNAEIVLEFIINKFNETIPFAANYYKAIGYGLVWGFMQVGIRLFFG